MKNSEGARWSGELSVDCEDGKTMRYAKEMLI